MRIPKLSSVAKWTLGGLALTQGATIGALVGIDAYRRRGRQGKKFPSCPPIQVRVGHDVLTLYTKGRDLFDDMLRSIDEAQDSIYFETYIWKDDRTGQAFKDAFTRAAQRGVQVYLAYDVFANTVVNPRFFRFDPAIHLLRHTLLSGFTGRLVNRLPGLNHRKLLVVDQRIGYIGGYNIGSLYATRWRDTHARIEGEAALDLANAFIDYWNQMRPHREAPIPDVVNRPWEAPITVSRNVPSVGVYPIRYQYLEAIDRASDHIWLTHAYLIPDDDLTLALLEAADRGVDVRVIVPAESNHVVADWLSRGFYQLLLSRGIKLFLYQDAMVHAKTATIDGVWSTIGTANLDRLSLMGNYEVNVEILDEEAAAALERIFDMDLGNCVELTLDDWKRRSIAAKLSEAVLTPLRPLL